MDNRVVYILKDDRFYIGYTNNLARRIIEHKNGKTHTAKRIGDNIVLYGYIQCSHREEARNLERKIKKGGHYDRRIENNKDRIITNNLGL